MPNPITFLFNLDSRGQYRLAQDDAQWIVEKGQPGKAIPGKDRGYRGLDFVCSQKTVLERCIRERGIVLCLSAVHLLMALPSSFSSSRSAVARYGGDEYRRDLVAAAKEIALRASSDLAPDVRTAHFHALIPLETPVAETLGKKILLSNRDPRPELISADMFPKTHDWVRSLGPDVYALWLNWVSRSVRKKLRGIPTAKGVLSEPAAGTDAA
ncbi:hypothetical protein ACW9UR_23660 [Halovulum sp. GXIMD14794]